MKRIIHRRRRVLDRGSGVRGLGYGRPPGEARPGRPPAEKPPAKPKLPAPPSDVRNRKKWLIGVKCDFPPFGFIDVRATTTATTFRSRDASRPSRSEARRRSISPVTTPSRSRRSCRDASTSSSRRSRGRRPRRPRSTSRSRTTRRRDACSSRTTLVRRSVDLGGKTIVTTAWCDLRHLDARTASRTRRSSRSTHGRRRLAVKDGRADTFMFDDAFLLGVATQDRDRSSPATSS